MLLCVCVCVGFFVCLHMHTLYASIYNFGCFLMHTCRLLTNGTRRQLGEDDEGEESGGSRECQATNPIDRCWRCRKDWNKNRKKLAGCAKGFGRKTTGGKEGEYYVVTEDTDSDVENPKPGTLRHAVIQEVPLWIIFAKSMVIKLEQELLITSNKTIDGRGVNVHIAYGAGLTIQFVENVIIHGIRIHHVVTTSGGIVRDSILHLGLRTVSDGDGINIFGSSNVWVDHVSMEACHDGLIDAIQGSTAITISNCKFNNHDHVRIYAECIVYMYVIHVMDECCCLVDMDDTAGDIVGCE